MAHREPKAPRPECERKRCTRCNQTLPIERFPLRGNGARHSWCRACKRAYLRRHRPRRRPPRFNARGDAYCHQCERYLPVTAFRVLSPPSFAKPRLASYCQDCQRALDRLRWRGERRARLNRRRIENQRRQRERERRERIDFVASSIVVLRKRGLTKAEICRLADVPFSSLLAWEAKRRPPTPNVAERFAILLRETAHLPVGETPVFRRRLPHPELPALLARIRPQVAAYPLRSRWRQDQRSHQEAARCLME